MFYSENFSMQPLSPTRVLVSFSPYFRTFFPIKDPTNTRVLYPPLLEKEQFDRRFWKPVRMELFEPCQTVFNRFYRYEAKSLTEEDVIA